MTQAALNKREQNAAKTRDKLVDAAVRLYGERSIDDVSLREIAVAAGQKNSNALQYHFCNRDGLLQAIIDKHANAISLLRDAYVERAGQGEWPAHKAAARCMVMPIIDYVEANEDGLDFVKVVSQIAALYQNGATPGHEVRIRFPENKPLLNIFDAALAGVPPRETQRRIYLVVTNTFHSIADIYRAAAQQSPGSPIACKQAMVDQLILLLESFFCAPATKRGRER